MMPDTDALHTVAELGIGLAGFSGIVIALSRDPGELAPFDALRVMLLLGSSISAAVLALLPIGLLAAGMQGAPVWRVSSALLALATAAMLFESGRRFLSLPEPLTPAIGQFLILGGVVNLLCQFLNAIALGFDGSFAVFYFGLVWLIVFSGIQFILLMFRRPRS
jgi:hypothetical protein